MKHYLELFVSFFKVGLLTFGGGYAMLPMLQREVVQKRGWITEEQILAYVGHLQGGPIGAACATLGVIFPSLLIITALASVIRRISHYAAVAHAFAGIRVAVSVLVLQAKLKLWRKGVKGPAAIGVWLAALAASAFFGVSAVWIVAAAIVAGLALAWKEARS